MGGTDLCSNTVKAIYVHYPACLSNTFLLNQTVLVVHNITNNINSFCLITL